MLLDEEDAFVVPLDAVGIFEDTRSVMGDDLELRIIRKFFLSNTFAV